MRNEVGVLERVGNEVGVWEKVGNEVGVWERVGNEAGMPTMVVRAFCRQVSDVWGPIPQRRVC